MWWAIVEGQLGPGIELRVIAAGVLGGAKLTLSTAAELPTGIVAAHEAVSGSPDVAIHSPPVTEPRRIELLPFLKEQAISITAHRLGTSDRLSDDVLREATTSAKLCMDTRRAVTKSGISYAMDQEIATRRVDRGPYRTYPDTGRD